MNKRQFNRKTKQLEAIERGLHSDRELMNVVMQCTEGPWEVIKDQYENFAIQSANKSLVCNQLPKQMSNYDRRLMAMSPALAWEVLYLRSQLKKLRDGYEEDGQEDETGQGR